MSAHKPFERKHFFIDRRLQGRYMLTFLVPMLIMLAFMVFTLYFASQSIVGTATSMVREGVDNIVVGTLQDEPEPTVQMYQGIVSEVRDYLRTFSSDTRYRRLMVVTLMWVFGLGVLIVIIQIVLLTVYFSHRVAGPIYRLEKACGNLIEGDYTEVITLRRGDEVKNLAGMLNSVIEATRERLRGLRDESDPEKRRELAAGLKL